MNTINRKIKRDSWLIVSALILLAHLLIYLVITLEGFLPSYFGVAFSVITSLIAAYVLHGRISTSTYKRLNYHEVMKAPRGVHATPHYTVYQGYGDSLFHGIVEVVIPFKLESERVKGTVLKIIKRGDNVDITLNQVIEVGPENLYRI